MHLNRLQSPKLRAWLLALIGPLIAIIVAVSAVRQPDAASPGESAAVTSTQQGD
ncbi:hypothetical protein [Maricaulis sp.]|uniref:hypothetical protein n=1 Tax=Maricaulis sp. TaxID=1486257 RepID=UPI003A910AB7